MKEFIKQLLVQDRDLSALSWEAKLIQFRTIELNVPRQSGKTTFLKEYFNDHSSMLFVHNQVLVDQIEGSINGTSDFLYQFRGFPRKHVGPKLQAILVDEYWRMGPSFDAKLQQLIDIMHASKGLTKDFHIIKLGTK